MKQIKRVILIIKNICGLIINTLKNLYYYCTMRHKECEVKNIYLLQDTEAGYNRLDIVVRYLAIEEYYGKNSIGFQLYRKMQGKRIDSGYMNESEKKFRKLILSWEVNGYDKKSEISLDSRLSLMDGSHRMSLALYYGIEKITCKIYKKRTNYQYRVEWFEKNGFSDEEIKVILAKEKEIRERLTGK